MQSHVCGHMYNMCHVTATQACASACQPCEPSSNPPPLPHREGSAVHWAFAPPPLHHDAREGSDRRSYGRAEPSSARHVGERGQGAKHSCMQCPSFIIGKNLTVQ